MRSDCWPKLGRRRTPFRKGTLESQVAQFWKTLHIDYTTQPFARGVQNCTTGIADIAFDARCSVHNRTDRPQRKRQNRSYVSGTSLRHIHMVVIFAVLITATAVWSLRRGVPGSGSSANLGWMSEQWLSEHRAGHAP